MHFALGFQILVRTNISFVYSMPLFFNSLFCSRHSPDADAVMLTWALIIAHQLWKTNGKPLHEWYGTMGFRLVREVKFMILIYW